MENIIGNRIGEARQKAGMTQDQFGARYSVSGPAIFKFEKGYLKPSLDLWLKMARDFDIPERKAVLLWVRAKLPEGYKKYIDLSATSTTEPTTSAARVDRVDYARIGDSRETRQQLASDPNLPQGLKDLAEDKEFWVLYRPAGEEVQLVVDKFGVYTDAKESTFREAFRLIREFLGSQ